MATYAVQGPNGEHYQIDGPDDADPSDVISQVAGAHHYGSGQMLDAFGGQAVPSNSAAAMAARSPTSTGSTLQVGNPGSLLGIGPSSFNTGIPTSANVQNFSAGYGKAGYDLLSGVGQDLGLVSRQDVANDRALDAPLMSTSAGKWGHGIGTTADMLWTGMLPGAGTLAGAAAIGTGLGLAQPSTSTGETLKNVGLGAAAGPGSILGGRAVGALGQGAWAAIEPLLRGGQQRVAARALQSFAGGPEAAAEAAQTIGGSGNVLPGLQPTTAELANNAGLSQMERSLRNHPEYLSALTARNQANRGVMTSALQDIAGTDADLAAATAERSKLTSPLYAAARDATANGDSALTSLLGRPSMQSAWQRAQTLARESGDTLVVGKDMPEHVVNSSILDDSGKAFSTTQAAQTAQYSGKAIQYLKMSLNDAVNQGKQTGMGAHELGAMRDTLHSLNDWTSLNLPQMRLADAAYAGMSKPINQMEVGQALTKKLMPALSDFGNNTRLNANQFAGAVRNGDTLAAQVTGYKGATLQGTLTPAQYQTVTQVGQQLARRANADELGRAVGSNTGQNLISQNVLRQVLGPLGLPQSMVERAAGSALGQSVLRPVQWAAQAGQPHVMDILAQSALEPQFAARLLSSGVNPGMAHMIWARQGLLGPLGNSVAYASQQ